MWFNGRTEVSKTFDEGSIPSTPATSLNSRPKPAFLVAEVGEGILVVFGPEAIVFKIEDHAVPFDLVMVVVLPDFRPIGLP